MGAEKKKSDDGSVQLIKFSFWNNVTEYDLSVSSLHIGTQLTGNASGIVTRIELIGDMVIADISSSFEDKTPIQYAFHASAGSMRIARPGEVEGFIRQAKKDRGIQE